MLFSVLCLLCLCARLFICALWSPAGKGLTSGLSFVVPYCMSLSHWYLGSCVALDCIYSWSLYPYLLWVILGRVLIEPLLSRGYISYELTSSLKLKKWKVIKPMIRCFANAKGLKLGQVKLHVTRTWIKTLSDLFTIYTDVDAILHSFHQMEIFLRLSTSSSFRNWHPYGFDESCLEYVTICFNVVCSTHVFIFYRLECKMLCFKSFGCMHNKTWSNAIATFSHNRNGMQTFIKQVVLRRKGT